MCKTGKTQVFPSKSRECVFSIQNHPVLLVLRTCHAALRWFYNGFNGFTHLPQDFANAPCESGSFHTAEILYSFFPALLVRQFARRFAFSKLSRDSVCFSMGSQFYDDQCSTECSVAPNISAKPELFEGRPRPPRPCSRGPIRLQPVASVL